MKYEPDDRNNSSDVSRKMPLFRDFPHPMNRVARKPAEHSGSPVDARPGSLDQADPKGTSQSYPLICHFCGQDADAISFFTRTFPSGRVSVESPALICQPCHDREMNLPSEEAWSPYYARPLASRICHLTFEKIASYTKQELVRFWSARRFEVNQFRQPGWKKTVWRIWFLGRPVKTVP